MRHIGRIRAGTVAGMAIVAAFVACRGGDGPPAPQAGPGATTTTTTATTTTTTMPPPPPVWRGARWGMTPDEVLAAFPGEAQTATPPVPFQAPATGAADVVIAAHDADGARFRVLFGFAGGRLSHIQLAAPKAAEATCYDVETRTTGEHGEPSSRRETTTSLQTKESVWTLPAQTIRLVCADKPSLGYRTVTLDHAPAGAAAAKETAASPSPDVEAP
jgi:hypothetical protein